MLLQYTVFDINFLFHAMFMMKVFCSDVFLNNAFHVGVRQRIQKLI